MTDIDGKEPVIDCDKAKAQVVLEKSNDAGCLV